MTVVLACTDGLAELVAVTDTGKLPRGVPCCFPGPWHPANASTPSKPTKNIPSRSLAFVLFRPLANMPTSPTNGNSRTAYTGAVFPMPPGKTEANAVVLIVSVTCAEPTWLSVGGLKVQAVPNGKFEQLKRMLPNCGLKD